MSPNPNSGGDPGAGRMYGFPTARNEDRHIQNIMDHTNSMFSTPTQRIPQFTYGGAWSEDPSNAGAKYFTNPFAGDDMMSGQQQQEELDDFDLQILGQPSAPPPEYHFGRPAAEPPRISLPNFNLSSSGQRRVLGDASHHFRPFVSRGDDYRPQFLGNPLQAQPSPNTQPIFERDGSHRVGSLQPGTQLATPPFYRAPPPKLPPPPEQSEHSSSSSELGRSSPSTHLSIRRQEPTTSSRAQPLSRPVHISLDLSHAPLHITPKRGDTYLLDPRKVLPDKCRGIFPYQLFNTVQSKSFPLAYGSNDNIVISAPTGSGKTAVLEMAICKLVMTSGGEHFKIVYQAPTKSLCSERARDWEKKFSHLSLHCAELTGDTSHAQTRRVGQASIIVTTPEKWDSITRKWSDHHRLLSMVRLVLIDEIHILNDSRGATLEAVVSRMKTSGANVRFVGLSATVPNIEDIATWLGKDHSNQSEPATYESFGGETKTGQAEEHTEKKPIMVFCFTRKACEITASNLAEWWTTCSADDKPWPSPKGRIPVINKELQETVRYGVAFHHAGLYADERAAIEQNFLSGQLHVICCTSTLAVGVNLPCHTVVLKGTVAYSDGMPQELSDLDVLQMLGRAGRPQFDRSATAVILTRRDKVERYEKMVSGKEKLESKLHLNLIEHLNSEVGLGTIQTLDTAKKWIDGTFLNVRMRRDPDKYIVKDGETGANADENLQQWCERDIRILQQYRLVTQGESFKCTEYGNAMSKYMVKFETMKLLLAIPKAPTMEQLRAAYRKLNKYVAYPIQGTVNEPWHYVSILIQMHLGHVELPNDQEMGFLKKQMASEKFIIFDRLNRLVRCLVDCKVFDGDAVGVRTGLDLVRAISAGAWENHPVQIQQVPGIGPVAMRKFQAQDVRTVLDLAKLNFDHIERIMSRNPPYGKNISKVLEGFPQLTMRVEVLGAPGTYKKLGGSIGVVVRAILGYKNQKHPPSWSGKIPAVTFLAETSDGKIAYFSRSNIKNINGTNGLELKFPVLLNRPDEVVSCQFSCEEIVGTQVVDEVQVNTPASAFAALDAQASANPVSEAQVDYMTKHAANDIADEDMLEALDEATNPSYSPPYDDLLDGDDDGFLDIDELTNDQSPATPAPTQMKNGRWLCNHCCRGGGFTKNGKLCTHRCCKEGLEKPRPPPKRKSVEDSQPTHSTASRKKPKSQHNTEDGPRQKKTGYHDDQMVELVDLSGLVDDDSDLDLTGSASEQATSRKNKLPGLHRKAQGQHVKAPARITKSITKSTDSPKSALSDRSAPDPFELQYELDDSDARREEGEEEEEGQAHVRYQDLTVDKQVPLPEEASVQSSPHNGLDEGGDADQPFFLDSNPFEVAVNAEAESSQSKAPEWASELSPEVMDLIKGIVEVDGWKP
ncbi:P-loop containing nucleoside triphosphate hydrolase protein [Apiospora phragmitis]|uniref:DNA 3'-5' helicase n=1 Tax=Apiospora phragmitis TaxID=2905665 RepID=A0ABR1VBX3_9PEZI